MTSSTPPAWHWLDECEVPVAVMDPAVVNKSLTTDPCPDCGWRHKPWVLCHEYANAREALSADSRNLPDSDGLREQNDSPDTTYQDCWPSERYKSDGPDQCDECRCPPGQPHAPGCDVSCSPVVSCDRKDDATGCDEAAQVTNAQSNAGPEHRDGVRFAHETPTNLPVGARSEHPNGMDIIEEPAVETHEDLQGKDADKMADTFDVPFRVQEWMFEALIETEVDHLHEIIDDHHDEIVDMARKRHREGFVAYGSEGYQWNAKTRLLNVLEELSDGGTYLTMGEIE